MKQNKPKNVLCLPSVLFAVLGVGFATFQVPLDHYWETGSFKDRSLQKAAYYTIAALVASASARYSEDEETYTPTKFLPGRTRDQVFEQQNTEYLEDDGVL